jgi:uncharacterized protein
MRSRRVAIIGSGIAGLSAAHALGSQAEITLFESESWFGGHAHTVDVRLKGVRHGVDTGFLVFNERTYPGLIQLFDELGVERAPSEMSFSVQAPAQNLEWCGNDLNGVFAQRSNIGSPRFWRMLTDVLRFNRLATGVAQRGDDAELAEPIGEFLQRHRFGSAFREGYFLPMVACIWSCPMEQMLHFPMGTMIRFCHNHGLLQVSNRPQWYTVRGGSRHYVNRILESVPHKRLHTRVQSVRRLPPGSGETGVMVETRHGVERFDEVVLACHTDQALALLPDASTDEKAVLGAIRYQSNRVVLHTDASMLPSRPRAWAAWNYERAADNSQEREGVCLHYLINRLQPLPWDLPVVVSMNPLRPLARGQVLGEWNYEHPVFDEGAVAAQRRLPSIQGVSHLWFCGAWARYGFHEDGLMAGQAVAAGMFDAWARERPMPEQQAA